MVAVAVASSLLVASPSARAEATPPIGVAEPGPIDLSRKAATVTVTNDTDRTITIRASASMDAGSPLVLMGRSNAATQVAQAVTLTIGAAGTETLTIDLGSRAPRPKTAEGELTLAMPPSASFPDGYVLRRALVVAPLAAPEIAVTSWTVSDLWGPFSSPNTVIDLPLAGSTPCAALDLPAVGDRVGTVAFADHSVVVLFDGCIRQTKTQPRVLRVKLGEVPEIGAAFEGAIDLTSTASDDDAVSLSVNVASTAFWPLFLLALGLALALWVQGWRSSGSLVSVVAARINDLRGRVGGAPGDDKDVEQTFHRIVGASPWAGYRIAPAILSATKSLLARLEDLEASKRFSLADDDDDFVALKSEVDLVAKAIDSWVEFGDDLNRLSVAVAFVKAAGEVPAFVDRVERDLLVSSELQSIETALARIADVAQARELAENWSVTSVVLWRAQARIEHLVENLDALDEAQKAAVRDAEMTLSQATVALRQAHTPAQVVEARGGIVKDAFAAVARLDSIRLTRAFGARTVDSGPSPHLAALAEAAVPLEAAASGPEARSEATFLRRRTSVLNAAIVALFCIATLWSGLAALYNGQNWGNPADFVAAFLWGLLGGAVTVPLAEAIEKYSTGRSSVST